ncbi:MAG: toll/interleukin-1 receptor domain-containing protein [Rickettsiales bacterium]
MASLLEYFYNDFWRYRAYGSNWPLALFLGEKYPSPSLSGSSFLGLPELQEHSFLYAHRYDEATRSFPLIFYIPAIEEHEILIIRILENLHYFLDHGLLKTGPIFNEKILNEELDFSGTIYFYSENIIGVETQKKLEEYAGLRIIIREKLYAEEKSKVEKPVAFISYDNRDKEVAEQIVFGLQKMNFPAPIWFDQYSLKWGNNMRKTIEDGLKRSKKCIVVLSQNYMENRSWAAEEFESAYQKGLHEKEDIFLPIWKGVTEKEVYEFSPKLKNVKGIIWSEDNKDKNMRNVFDVLKELL